MLPPPTQLIYRHAGVECLDEVRPLWEKLNAHHADLSPRFGGALRQRTFDARKQELLTKGGADRIRLELVSAGATGPIVAYCISTVSEGGVGEIDSLYVEEQLRGHGIGGELMRHALAWLNGKKVTAKIVSVMGGNDDAVAFYRRFGFHPRTIMLQEHHE